MILRLKEEHLRMLKEESKNSYPAEACGILFGHLDDEEAVLKRVRPMKNVLESATRFQIDPEEFVRTLSEGEKNGVELIGFFHSHPTPAYPSPTDLEYMKLWPQTIWLIVSSVDCSVTAYRIIDGEPRRVDIEVSDKD